MLDKKDTILLLRHLEMQKESLMAQVRLGIIDIDDSNEENAMITKKERNLKKQFVKERHVTKTGTPRSISYHAATEQNPKAYYITKLPNGRKIKATSMDIMIDKLFEIYAEGIADFSVTSVFKAALLEKEITENPKQKTIMKNKADFKRLITPEFAAMDVREITERDLKKYIQAWVNDVHPKKSVFMNLKGILNLIFDYAYIHQIIPKNPLSMIKNKAYLKSCDTRRARPEEKLLSPEEIKMLQDEVYHRMTLKKYGSYYINGYAMLFAIETGVRVGELCALKWEDIQDTSIHIHAQQLSRFDENKHREYYYDHSTKNEKGESMDGREFPLTKRIKAILSELRAKQEVLNIQSEFIFCHENGDWIKSDAYLTFLRRLCKSFGFKVTNNHAFRISLNSNVFIPKGISVADRAAMLGHSISTNEKYYSYAQKDYLRDVRALLDEDGTDEIEPNDNEPEEANMIAIANETPLNATVTEYENGSNDHKILPFPAKKEA